MIYTNVWNDFLWYEYACYMKYQGHFQDRTRMFTFGRVQRNLGSAFFWLTKSETSYCADFVKAISKSDFPKR